MAITSRRTGLISGFKKNATPRTGLIWLMDGGEGVKESHRGVGSNNAYMGHALNFIGNRAAERELPIAKNTRRSV